MAQTLRARPVSAAPSISRDAQRKSDLGALDYRISLRFRDFP